MSFIAVLGTTALGAGEAHAARIPVTTAPPVAHARFGAPENAASPVLGAPHQTASIIDKCSNLSAYPKFGDVCVTGSSWAPASLVAADPLHLDVFSNGPTTKVVGPSNQFGLKWQCTELAVRWAAAAWGEGNKWAWRRAGWTSGAAQDMWGVGPHLTNPLQQVPNGSPQAPKKGDLLIFHEPKGVTGPGHVAIVLGVNRSTGKLTFIGENQYKAPAVVRVPISPTNYVSATGFSKTLIVTGWLSPGSGGGGTGTWAVVSTGYDHTCAIRTDGTLWCWGDNYWGQLGIGNTTNQATPTEVGTSTGWATVSAGSTHTCATRAGGTLWCWGDKSYGELGTGDANQLIPSQVGTSTGWATVSAGEYHTCAIRTDGSLWCWGYNLDGELGTGDTANQLTPTEVGTGWATVSAGGYHTCAISTGGSLWCWGNNGNGELGTGDATNQLTPTEVGTGWATVSAGYDHTCATRTDRSLWCWGVLGTPGHPTNQLTPSQVGTSTSWATVSAGEFHTCATRTDGSLWCWGDNSSGQLGTGDTTNQATPTEVGTSTGWALVDAGGVHTCATRTDGSLWCWGDNGNGELGTGDSTQHLTPTQVG